MPPVADPVPDPDRDVPFLPGLDRVARQIVPLGRRPVVLRQHSASSVRHPVLRRPRQPVRVADGRIGFHHLEDQLLADRPSRSADGRHEVHDALPDAADAAFLVQ